MRLVLLIGFFTIVTNFLNFFRLEGERASCEHKRSDWPFSVTLCPLADVGFLFNMLAMFYFVTFWFSDRLHSFSFLIADIPIIVLFFFF